jgi:hypothetical protein
VKRKGGFLRPEDNEGVLPALVDELHRRLRDGDTQSPVTSEEVEEVVSSLIRIISGDMAHKKPVGRRKKRRTYKGRTNHVARMSTMCA